MSSVTDDRVAAALRNLSSLPRLDLNGWETLIAQARNANLMGCLATRLLDAGTFNDVPVGPRAHLSSALVLAKAQRTTVLRELDQLRIALDRTTADIVLLKGAAYVLAQLPASRGRMFTDIDILVPRPCLPEVEAALMMHGWATTHLDAYDQRYYREWMHELPPMRHVTRATVVDVHHAILPSTARLHPDSTKLLAAARTVPGEPRFKVLAPIDMILHSATHLFQNEELEQGLRDLVDLDALLRDVALLPEFWPQLVERAAELELLQPLYYGLRYASAILGTSVPPDILEQTIQAGPSPPLRPLMDLLFVRALRPDHPSASDRLTPLARKLLYVRAHWLRMPPLLLIRHLTIKATRRKPESATGAAI